jgi:glycosyltransferase involved in cell wall biosynthesis
MESTNLRVGIICPDYPDKEKSAYAFVHARAKLYQKNGIFARVFIPSNSENSYILDNIQVIKSKNNNLLNFINEFNPDILAVHFPTYKIISFLKKTDLPQVAWIHGHEILWKFRLGPSKNILDYIKKRVVLIPRELYQICKVRNFLDRVEYSVFVSNWMLKSAERNSLKKYKNAVIIPNPVDTELFRYRQPQNISKAISLRSFNNTKYGLDIAIKAYANVSQSHLHIYGQGRFKNKYIRLVQKTNSNTQIIDQSIEHNKIPDLYRPYGFFIAPSRVEAQGLAMCEAMSCGLPVIATNVGGIPEFVRDGIDGYLVPPNNPAELRRAVFKLTSDPQQFIRMSRNAAEHIKHKCSKEIIIAKEIEIIQKAIKNYNEK